MDVLTNMELPVSLVELATLIVGSLVLLVLAFTRGKKEKETARNHQQRAPKPAKAPKIETRPTQTVAAAKAPRASSSPKHLRKLRKAAAAATGLSNFWGSKINENYFGVDGPPPRATEDSGPASPPTKETVSRLINADDGYERTEVLTALIVAKGSEERALALLRSNGEGPGEASGEGGGAVPCTPKPRRFTATSIREFSTSQTEAPPPKEDGAAPKLMATLVEGSLSSFRTNMDEPGWATGPSGSAKLVKRKGGVTVRSRPHPGGNSKSLQWRVDATFGGTTADAVDSAYLYENRVAWDPAIANPGYLRRYQGAGGKDARGDDDLVDVCCYNTKPAAGGFISSRSFVDVRVKRTTSDPATGCVTHAGSSFEVTPQLNDEMIDGWLALADAQGLVRARNLSGSGLLIRERMADSNTKVVDIIMITTSEIGGSLPVGVVNGATGDALYNLVNGLHRSMLKSGQGGLVR